MVGGHCIGVDPYYLAQKAQEVGYHPEIILAGRRLNDSMGSYVAAEVIKLMVKKDIAVKSAKILVLGITFKENCPDIRNTKVIDIINELTSYNTEVDIYDPWANPQEVEHEYQITSFKELPANKYDAVVLAVAHEVYKKLNMNDIKKENAVVYDVKAVLDKNIIDGRL